MTVQPITVTVAGHDVTVNAVVNVTAGAPVLAVWSDVAPGANRLPTVTVDQSVYPDSLGVQFWLNGQIDLRSPSARPNGYDATGPQENSTYHMFPALTLTAGNTLEARWVDGSGSSHVALLTVDGAPPPPPPQTGGGVGFPNGTNTGPIGTLTPGTAMLITAPGTIIENRSLVGSLQVNADNVTIRNCYLTGGLYTIDIYPNISGTIIEDCEIDRGPAGRGGSDGGWGIFMRTYLPTEPGRTGHPRNTKIRRCDIHGAKLGIGGWGIGLLVEDCFVHDNWYGTDSHSTDCSLDGCQGVVYRHNSFEMPNPGASSCTALYGNNRIDDVLYDDNLYNGGAYALHAGYLDGPHPTITNQATNVRIVNNRFGRKYHPNCGLFGTIRSKGPDTVVSGNVWDDTGQPI